MMKRWIFLFILVAAALGSLCTYYMLGFFDPRWYRLAAAGYAFNAAINGGFRYFAKELRA